MSNDTQPHAAGEASTTTRRTIDDASNEEWLHAAARIAGGNHVEEPDDEISDSDTMSGPIRGEKESALCAVWLAYQTELISEQEVIRQSVALATAADLEISAMRKEIEHLRPTARICNNSDELRALLAKWLKVADDAIAEARDTGHAEYNVTVGLIKDTRAALQLAKEASK